MKWFFDNTLKGSGDYSNRETYRRRVETQLAQWRTAYKDTELFICAETLLETQAWDAVAGLRRELDAYIVRQPEFLTSLSPIEPLPDAPEAAIGMCRAAHAAGVGPMAAVAGAFAARVGEALLKFSSQVVVENGGDIWMRTGGQSTVAVYAGNSPLSMKIGILVDAAQPVSVCTSSGTVGPSLSFGKADAAVVVSRDATLADACATRLGNEIKAAADIAAAVELICGIPGVIGALAVVGEACGAAGNIELKALQLLDNRLFIRGLRPRAPAKGTSPFGIPSPRNALFRAFRTMGFLRGNAP